LSNKGHCPPFRQTFNVGDELVCPVCGEKFIADENTSYAIPSGFVCSLYCFFDRVNKVEKEREDPQKPFKLIPLGEKRTNKIVEEQPKKKKRGRPLVKELW
jgi:hypothetical protein